MSKSIHHRDAEQAEISQREEDSAKSLLALCLRGEWIRFNCLTLKTSEFLKIIAELSAYGKKQLRWIHLVNLPMKPPPARNSIVSESLLLSVVFSILTAAASSC